MGFIGVIGSRTSLPLSSGLGTSNCCRGFCKCNMTVARVEARKEQCKEQSACTKLIDMVLCMFGKVLTYDSRRVPISPWRQGKLWGFPASHGSF